MGVFNLTGKLEPSDKLPPLRRQGIESIDHTVHTLASSDEIDQDPETGNCKLGPGPDSRRARPLYYKAKVLRKTLTELLAIEKGFISRSGRLSSSSAAAPVSSVHKKAQAYS